MQTVGLLLRRMKLRLLIIPFLLCGSVYGQIDSIGKGQLPRLVRWYEPAVNLDTNKVDSNVYMKGYEVHTYTEMWRKDRLDLGHPGTPSFEILPQENRRRYFRDAEFFNPYFHFAGNVGFYNATVPYTRALYGVGPNEEQKLDVLLTRNVKPGWNFTASMKRLRAEGNYVNQSTGMSAFGFSSNYFSPNGKFVLHAEAGINNSDTRQNGGIVDRNLFLENRQPTRAGILVNSEQAYMETDKRFFSATARYKVFSQSRVKKTKPAPADSLLQADTAWTADSLLPDTARHDSVAVADSLLQKTVSNDSLDKDSAISKQRNFDLQLVNRIHAGSDGTRYVDDAPVPRAYSLYNLTPNSTWLAAEQRYTFFENEAEAVFTTRTFDISGYYHLHSGNLTFPTGGENLSFTDHAVGGRLRISPVKNVDLHYDASTYFLGFNAGGIKSHATAVWSPDSSSLSARAHYNFDRTRGELNFYRFNADNGFGWNNDFDFMNRHNLRAGLRYKNNVGVHAEYWNTTNFLFFGTEGLPEQGGTMQVVSLGGDVHMPFGIFALDAEASYNQSANTAVFRVPEVIGKASLYLNNELFGGKIHLKTGFYTWYLSSFYGNAYSPLTRAYYIQNQYQNNAILYPGYFLDIRIYKTKVFVNASNITSGFLPFDYMAVPNYPMQDLVIRFGLAWDFVN